MKFLRPCLEYMDSYLKTIKFLESEGFPDIIPSSEIEKDPKKFIENTKLMETERCVEVLPYLVPGAMEWLVDEEKKEFIGRVSVRYELSNERLKVFNGNIGYFVNPAYRMQGNAGKLLNRGLDIAREKGLEEVIITCNFDNIGSKRTIENAGGIYINNVFDPYAGKDKLRYRIDLK